MVDEVDYGPLAALIGVWQGDKGMDIAPEPTGTEKNPYYETITFTAEGDVKNAERQRLAIVNYTQVVRRKSNDKPFHHQVGYWLYDAADKTIIETLTIPRGVTLLAGGVANISDNTTVFEVVAKVDDPDWKIIEAPFMQKNARTLAFTHKLQVNGNEMSYAQTTLLDIYGKPFEHTDDNTLTKIG